MRVIVMGVTGSGKSSVGAALAAELGYEFADADDFHPPASVAAMAQGNPLTDAERWPWLDAVGAWMEPRTDAVGHVRRCVARIATGCAVQRGPRCSYTWPRHKR